MLLGGRGLALGGSWATARILWTASWISVGRYID